MTLDRDEQIIAAALNQAEREYANQRGAGARIEFKQEGHAKVTITISRALVIAGQGARFDDLGTLCRGAPIGHPRLVRVRLPSSLALALTGPIAAAR